LDKKREEKLIMALKLVKDSDQQLPPHRQALADNLRAIRTVRAEVDVVNAKDRAAAADIALADATTARITTLTEEVDQLKADASYNGAEPPDTRAQEKQLTHLQQLYKSQTDTARAAARIRERCTADATRLNAVLSEHASQTTRLLWITLREEELAGLAAEFLEKEAAFLSVHKRVFAAALAVDTISKEQSYGQYVGSGDIVDLHISRPTHEAFNPNPLLPEQAWAARKEYMAEVAMRAAVLVAELSGM
jgi:hypothetical protein